MCERLQRRLATRTRALSAVSAKSVVGTKKEDMAHPRLACSRSLGLPGRLARGRTRASRQSVDDPDSRAELGRRCAPWPRKTRPGARPIRALADVEERRAVRTRGGRRRVLPWPRTGSRSCRGRAQLAVAVAVGERWRARAWTGLPVRTSGCLGAGRRARRSPPAGRTAAGFRRDAHQSSSARRRWLSRRPAR